ncbi:hypothetical protein CC85DRAFT_123846 [Cutaneotrichosporon oleaginosum]|uniref:Uncharacterized protein n=1 Tax=Cutaneotrichosporon oleaginosum TaxID=879819 RepID=A0A0J0XJX0_9TREE|nr:uncharacterized protein CC85DRAFT_123846 [Cutaneotrichosporon oleaginosum]KLT41371.1 hypothetical protein CC85DRAFT_123846 [Cutaneotrichosporon oleaginosum]TXT06313.1 hypothetical protein COLE_05644 [Cutaneotrichosporon oleaginosum]
MTQATAIIRQIGAEAKPRLRAVRNWLTCVLTEPRDPRPAVALGPGIAHLNLSPGIPIPDLTDQLDTPESATPPCLDPHPNTPLQTRYQSPEPSWKPWVEPFRPSVPVDRASSGRTACNPVKSNENILAPTPRQPPVVMEAWRTSLPFEHWRPTPSPFDYTTAYQHSWPLPSESTANQRMSGLGITHPSLWPSSRHNPTSSIAALKRLTLDLAPHAGASLTHSATQVQSQDACRNPSPRRNDRVRSPLSMYMAY